MTKLKTTPITQYIDALSASLDALDQLRDRLAPLPPIADPSVDLPALLALLTRFRVNSSDHRPLDTAANVFAERVAGRYVKDNVEDATRELLLNVDRRVADCLLQKAETKEVIASSAFGDGLRTIDSGLRLLDRLEPIMLSVGLVDSLPHSHWARDMMPTEDLYVYGNRSPAIVLGPMHAIGPPRFWYPTSLALLLTREFRAQQLRKAQEEAAEERREQEREARKFHESEVGQLRQRMRLLERLEQDGKIPPDVEPAPAVRGHVIG